MTENKQFNSLWEYEGGTGDIAIYNDEKYYWIVEKGYPQSKAIYDVIDLLNNQHKTIERLEKQLAHLEYRFTEYRNKVIL